MRHCVRHRGVPCTAGSESGRRGGGEEGGGDEGRVLGDEGGRLSSAAIGGPLALQPGRAGAYYRSPRVIYAGHLRYRTVAT